MEKAEEENIARRHREVEEETCFDWMVHICSEEKTEEETCFKRMVHICLKGKCQKLYNPKEECGEYQQEPIHHPEKNIKNINITEKYNN